MQTLHNIPIKEFFSELKSGPRGLANGEAENRIKKYGMNIFSEKKQTPMIVKFFLQFKNFFSILLLVGAALSFLGEDLAPGEGSIYVGYALVGVTILNALFTFIQQYNAERAMAAFKDLLPKKINVIRDDTEIEIETKYLVPGDVIVLHEGDKIPADARVIESYLLKVDHSALTGESEPQLRSTNPTSQKVLKTRNMVFSGTLVQSGTGKAVVVSTGDKTEIGKIANLTSSIREKKAKIQEELAYFIKIISTIAIVLGVLFFGIGFIVGRTFWESLVFAIGIIVANVPEGLLPTVTLTLSIAAKKMAKNNAFVKDMESIETLGSVTTICTDKTGTLTQNIMSVTNIFINNKEYSRKEIKSNLKNFTLLKECMTLCNNAHFTKKKNQKTGDPTEIALLEYANEFDDISWINQDNPRVYEIPFDSDKKYMITASRKAGKFTAFMKGAPEVIIEKCTEIVINNKKVKLDKKRKNEILKHNKHLSSKGLRVLGFAYKKVHHYHERKLEKNDYVFIGLVSMRDPPRKEVKKAISMCRTAGIRVIIVSGDNPVTVEAIGREVGLIRKKDPEVITGDKLSRMSDSELRKILDKKEVAFARTLPQDKLRIVHMLQQKGEIVAVTGDGVNDAPALKKAHVGVAMGKSGTDVAKEAANIILLDDNFATIINAIKTGRTIYDNIKSFIVYILTSNTPEILPFIFFVLFGWPLALPVLLILAIDLGTDVLPAISLGMEKSESDIMKNRPRDPKAKLLTAKMIGRSYAMIGPIQTLMAYIIFFIILLNGGWIFGSKIAMSSPLYMSAVAGFFSTVVITQIFNLIACRTTRTSTFRKAFKNKVMLIGIVVEILLLMILMFVPFMRKVFGMNFFDPLLIVYMIAGGVIILLLEEARKWAYRKYGIFGID